MKTDFADRRLSSFRVWRSDQAMHLALLPADLPPALAPHGPCLCAECKGLTPRAGSAWHPSRDPYCHGETCDCARCIPPSVRTLTRDWLQHTTATSRETFPGFQRLPTATGNWLCGFMLGRPDGERHARALDALLMMHEPYAPGAAAAAIREARAYLTLHGLADFTPPPQRKPRP